MAVVRPRRPQRVAVRGRLRWLAPAAALVAALVAGCGSSDGTDEFIEEFSARCREAGALITEAGTAVEDPGDFAAVEAAVTESRPIAERLVDDLRALEPPDHLRGDVDALLDTLELETSLYPQLEAAAADGDGEALTRLYEQGATIRASRARQSAELGISCAPEAAGDG